MAEDADDGDETEFNEEAEDAKNDLAEELFETVCHEAHKIMKAQPTVFVESDGYDDLIRRVAEKLATYAEMSVEGYRGPDYPPD